MEQEKMIEIKLDPEERRTEIDIKIDPDDFEKFKKTFADDVKVELDAMRQRGGEDATLLHPNHPAPRAVSYAEPTGLGNSELRVVRDAGPRGLGNAEPGEQLREVHSVGLLLAPAVGIPKSSIEPKQEPAEGAERPKQRDEDPNGVENGSSSKAPKKLVGIAKGWFGPKQEPADSMANRGHADGDGVGNGRLDGRGEWSRSVANRGHADGDGVGNGRLDGFALEAPKKLVGIPKGWVNPKQEPDTLMDRHGDGLGEGDGDTLMDGHRERSVPKEPHKPVNVHQEQQHKEGERRMRREEKRRGLVCWTGNERLGRERGDERGGGGREEERKGREGVVVKMEKGEEEKEEREVGQTEEREIGQTEEREIEEGKEGEEREIGQEEEEGEGCMEGNRHVGASVLVKREEEEKEEEEDEEVVVVEEWYEEVEMGGEEQKEEEEEEELEGEGGKGEAMRRGAVRREAVEGGEEEDKEEAMRREEGGRGGGKGEQSGQLVVMRAEEVRSGQQRGHQSGQLVVCVKKEEEEEAKEGRGGEMALVVVHEAKEEDVEGREKREEGEGEEDEEEEGEWRDVKEERQVLVLLDGGTGGLEEIPQGTEWGAGWEEAPFASAYSNLEQCSRFTPPPAKAPKASKALSGMQRATQIRTPSPTFHDDTPPSTLHNTPSSTPNGNLTPSPTSHDAPPSAPAAKPSRSSGYFGVVREGELLEAAAAAEAAYLVLKGERGIDFKVLREGEKERLRRMGWEEAVGMIQGKMWRLWREWGGKGAEREKGERRKGEGNGKGEGGEEELGEKKEGEKRRERQQEMSHQHERHALEETHERHALEEMPVQETVSVTSENSQKEMPRELSRGVYHDKTPVVTKKKQANPSGYIGVTKNYSAWAWDDLEAAGAAAEAAYFVLIGEKDIRERGIKLRLLTERQKETLRQMDPFEAVRMIKEKKWKEWMKWVPEGMAGAVVGCSDREGAAAGKRLVENTVSQNGVAGETEPIFPHRLVRDKEATSESPGKASQLVGRRDVDSRKVTCGLQRLSGGQATPLLHLQQRQQQNQQQQQQQQRQQGQRQEQERQQQARHEDQLQLALITDQLDIAPAHQEQQQQQGQPLQGPLSLPCSSRPGDASGDRTDVLTGHYTIREVSKVSDDGTGNSGTTCGTSNGDSNGESKWQAVLNFSAHKSMRFRVPERFVCGEWDSFREAAAAAEAACLAIKGDKKIAFQVLGEREREGLRG
ncbi:unnamed protein product, partial [Closterium sp. NIES-53]